MTYRIPAQVVEVRISHAPLVGPSPSTTAVVVQFRVRFAHMCACFSRMSFARSRMCSRCASNSSSAHMEVVIPSTRVLATEMATLGTTIVARFLLRGIAQLHIGSVWVLLGLDVEDDHRLQYLSKRRMLAVLVVLPDQHDCCTSIDSRYVLDIDVFAHGGMCMCVYVFVLMWGRRTLQRSAFVKAG